MRRACLALFLVVLPCLAVGCSDSSSTLQQSEPAKEVPDDFRNKMKNMNQPPSNLPKGAMRPPAKPAAEK